MSLYWHKAALLLRIDMSGIGGEPEIPQQIFAHAYVI
jgi:hypothetical protein